MREDLKFNGEALPARDHLLRMVATAAEIGAWCGFGGTLLCLVLTRRPEHDSMRSSVNPHRRIRGTEDQPPTRVVTRAFAPIVL